MKDGRVTGIKRIRIENFQSHEDSILDFQDGLNVIVGPSDQGKSAVIRAIRWVLYNEPRGTDFIRQGAAYARVTLEMTNKYKIVRERSKSRNRYTVIDPEGEESVFEGFGNEIPQEVIHAHGIPKVMLDVNISSSLNIGDQLEGPFLLSETGAVRAKAIGRLTGMHIMDNAIRDSITDMRREAQSRDRLDRELKEMDARLEEYGILDNIKEKLELVSGLVAELEQKNDKLYKLADLVKNLNTMEHEQKEDKEKISRTKDLEKAAESVKTAENLIRRYEFSAAIKERWKQQRRETEKALEQYKKLEAFNDYIEMPDLLDSKMGIFSRLCRIKHQYEASNNFINEGIRFVENSKLQIKELLYEYVSILKESRICPTCGSDIGQLKIDEIVRHYEEELK